MISLIAAVASNNVLGINGKMPWHLPMDFAWFKSQTLSKPIIMGRKTFESFDGKTLPKRFHIVISRTRHANTENVAWVSSIEEAIELAHTKTDDEIMVIGGGEIYKQAMHYADRLYLTEINASYEGDAFFPDFDKSQWHKITISEYPAENNQPSFSITQYDKI